MCAPALPLATQLPSISRLVLHQRIKGTDDVPICESVDRLASRLASGQPQNVLPGVGVSPKFYPRSIWSRSYCAWLTILQEQLRQRISAGKADRCRHKPCVSHVSHVSRVSHISNGGAVSMVIPLWTGDIPGLAGLWPGHIQSGLAITAYKQDWRSTNLR